MKGKRILVVLSIISILSVLLISAAAAAQGSFSASLNGSNEVPPVTTNAEGDFTATSNANATKLRVHLVVGRINDVVAAHIHCAPPGSNGPVGVTLYMGPPIDFGAKAVLASATYSAPDAGNSCGWVTIADVVAAMEAGGAYTNVHTVMVPSGEIRGNIQGN
jgi:hypothetical protein